MSQYECIPENEQGNVLSMFWVLLRMAEGDLEGDANTLDKVTVQAAYKLWNRVTGDSHKALWEE